MEPVAPAEYESGTLVVYEIVDGTRGLATMIEDVKSANREQYEEIWSLFSDLIPLEYRRMVVRYTVFSDGPDGVPAQMIALDDEQRTWHLLFNLDFGYNDDVLQRFDTAYILLHEFGHALTLENGQFAAVRPREAATADQLDECKAHYIDEGCLLASSYLGNYFANFWTDLYEERQSIPIDEETAFSATGDLFYDQYSDEFVTVYASTNPAEDIAESWTWFVLYDRPENASEVIDRKILQFYGYPELVAIRDYAQRSIPDTN